MGFTKLTICRAWPSNRAKYPSSHIDFRQLEISGSVGYTRATWNQTMNILQQGKLKVEDTITHRLPLQAWKEGFDLMEQKQAIKILLQP